MMEIDNLIDDIYEARKPYNLLKQYRNDIISVYQKYQDKHMSESTLRNMNAELVQIHPDLSITFDYESNQCHIHIKRSVRTITTNITITKTGDLSGNTFG